MEHKEELNDFVDYVKNLQITDFNTIADMVLEYFDHYRDLSEENEAKKELAWQKYIIITAKYGTLMAECTKAFVEINEFMKEVQEQ